MSSASAGKKIQQGKITFVFGQSLFIIKQAYCVFTEIKEIYQLASYPAHVERYTVSKYTYIVVVFSAMSLPRGRADSDSCNPHVVSEGCDQPGQSAQMCMLVGVFFGSTCHNVSFLMF